MKFRVTAVLCSQREPSCGPLQKGFSAKHVFFFLAHAEDELTETTQALEPQTPGVWPARGSGVGCVLSVDCTWIPPPMAIQGAQILPSSVTPAARAGGGSTVGLGGLQEVPKEFC